MIRHVFRSMFTQCTLVFITSFSVVMIFAMFTNNVNAASDIGYRWYSTSAVVDNQTSSYGAEVEAATIAWNDYTDLSLSLGSLPSGYGGIGIFQGDFGETGWDGGAIAYNQQNDSCSVWPSLVISNQCNTSDRKAHYGYIYFNDFYGTYDLPQYGARHELGHMWGLGHVDCSADSIMEEGTCRPNVPQTLRIDEISTINSWY